MIYENDKKVEEVMKTGLESISTSQILNIRNFCDQKKESLEMLAQYDLVKDAVLENIGEKQDTDAQNNRAYVENLLLERKRHNNYSASLSLVDKNFHVVASSSEEYTYNEESMLKHTKEELLTGEFFIGNVYERETPDGLKCVVAAYQGVFWENELIGYIVEEIETSQFDEYRFETELWNDGTFYILDGENVPITAGTQEEDGRKTLITSEEDRKNYVEAWQAIDHKKYPQGKVSYRYDGIDYITYYSDIENTNWGIRITVNLTSHKMAAKEYQNMLFMSAVLASLMLLVINSMITKRLVSPINGIVKTLNDVEKQQDYTLRVEKNSKDEIGFLAKEVNELLAYIERENLQEKEEQRKLKRKAELDSLTGVKNKKAIEQQILNMVQQAAESGRRIIVGFLDIDDFKDYNTLYGHQEGDCVIQFVAKTLEKNISGVVGRNGGDEFVFCVEKELNKYETELAAQKLLTELNKGFYSEKAGDVISVPCSIGIVSDAGRNINYVNIIQKADEAMYHVKENGKNNYHLDYNKRQQET